MLSRAVPQKPPEITDLSFGDLGLSDSTLAALGSIGFEYPTAIQAAAVPPAVQGRDVIGLAQTGSGKTAAFALPMIEKLRHRRGLGGLIMCPTREIALQTEDFLKAVGKKEGLRVVCLIGGVRMGPQIDGLRAGPDIVVATPGRLWDHYERRNLSFDKVQILVLDEGDHMLDLGFLPQIHRVMEKLPAERQTLLYSATMPAPIERLARRFMNDPVYVDILPAGRAAEGIEHQLYLVEPHDMRSCLMALVAAEPGSMLIFIRRKVDAEWASRQIAAEGHPVDRIHSDRSQSQRVAALEGLREGEHRVLVATDIAARGIDLPVVGHIINFGMPERTEDYIHRAGRTARGALEGIVSTIASWKDRESIQMVERAMGMTLPRCTLPGVPPWVERKSTIRGRQKLRRRLL